MARPSIRSPEEKLRIVLTVVRGELTVAEASLACQASPTKTTHDAIAVLQAGALRFRLWRALALGDRVGGNQGEAGWVVRVSERGRQAIAYAASGR